MPKTIQKLTESQKSLVAMCLSIAAARFQDHSRTVALPSVAEVFRRQASDALELSCMISGADLVTLDSDCD